MNKLRLSNLPHTWFIDLDGTLLRHNGHLKNDEQLLEGVVDLWGKIPPNDVIVLLSARADSYASDTLRYLKSKGVRFDYAIFSLPKGERILINDTKPSGLATAYAINLPRDVGVADISISVDE